VDLLAGMGATREHLDAAVARVQATLALESDSSATESDAAAESG
jgi:hypothetical protein